MLAHFSDCFRQLACKYASQQTRVPSACSLLPTSSGILFRLRAPHLAGLLRTHVLLLLLLHMSSLTACSELSHASPHGPAADSSSKALQGTTGSQAAATAAKEHNEKQMQQLSKGIQSTLL